MRQTREDRHGFRLRALIVVLWRGGLRIQEALVLGERDLDPRRGSLLVCNGERGRRREIGMDGWGCAQPSRSLAARVALPIGPLFCVIDGPTRGRPGRAPMYASNSAVSPPKQSSGAASRRISCPTPTRSSSRRRRAAEHHPTRRAHFDLDAMVARVEELYERLYYARRGERAAPRARARGAGRGRATRPSTRRGR